MKFFVGKSDVLGRGRAGRAPGERDEKIEKKKNEKMDKWKNGK